MKEAGGYTIKALAEWLDVRYDGDGDYFITDLACLSNATKDSLSFCVGKQYEKKLSDTRAGCVLLTEVNNTLFSGNKLITSDPYLCYAKISYLFRKKNHTSSSIHPSAIIADSVSLGNNISIGPNTVIESGVKIDSDCFIGANSFIGEDSHIGFNTTIYPNVNIYHDVHIGIDCILHSGSVVGADGFGFAPSKEGWQKIYQLGGVRIGNKVEVGANSAIDRGALDHTILEDGVKIDNQVQIAHNVNIGEHTAIAASTAIAGSTIIGKRCTIAGAVGIVGHITIADGVHVTAMSMITKSITQSGSYSSGVPMNDTRAWKKNAARFNHLDDMARQLSSLKKTMKK